jgi:uncharacterized LabA/DUF88 family protein
MSNRDQVAILIDNGYFTKIADKIYGKDNYKIDYLKLSDGISNMLNLDRFRTYFYDCPPYYKQEENNQLDKERAGRFNRFINALQKNPNFEIRLGKLVKRFYDNKPYYVQKGVDVLLTIDLLRLSLKNVVKHIALITGDADYVPVIKTIRDEGVKVYLFHSFEKGDYSDELYNVSDNRYPLNKEFLNNYLKK